MTVNAARQKNLKTSLNMIFAFGSSGSSFCLPLEASY
ncbi:rCG61081 [Rattus norvegicus]|uniref:RCG61081 n=1 Tax=Rattus norvegicus TaxID=10116 RepID=A6JKR2_RAT|nr:rCG61081 [Rattus norvegicus]